MSVPYPYAPASAQEGPSSPRRRQHAIQPPNLLTASLGNARHTGLGVGGSTQTPLSATSLSSPFSVYQPSPYPASPGGAMRGNSPMATRTLAAYNAPYNPQRWGTTNPSSSSTSTASGTRQRQTTRIESLAARPVGPDGMLSHLLTQWGFLLTHCYRACCLSTTTLFSSPWPSKRRLTTPCRCGFAVRDSIA